MKYRVHVTYTNGHWNLYDYDNLLQLDVAVTDWTRRIGEDVKAIAVYAEK